LNARTAAPFFITTKGVPENHPEHLHLYVLLPQGQILSSLVWTYGTLQIPLFNGNVLLFRDLFLVFLCRQLGKFQYNGPLFQIKWSTFNDIKIMPAYRAGMICL
jgi:hypothetical protein